MDELDRRQSNRTVRHPRHSYSPSVAGRSAGHHLFARDQRQHAHHYGGSQIASASTTGHQSVCGFAGDGRLSRRTARDAVQCDSRSARQSLDIRAGLVRFVAFVRRVGQHLFHSELVRNLDRSILGHHRSDQLSATNEQSQSQSADCVGLDLLLFDQLSGHLLVASGQPTKSAVRMQLSGQHRLHCVLVDAQLLRTAGRDGVRLLQVS